MTTKALLFLLSSINLINKYHQLNYLFIIDVSKVRETSRKAKLNKEGVKKFNQRQMLLGNGTVEYDKQQDASFRSIK